MNNRQAIDRLLKHMEWGWTEETAKAIELGIQALKENTWIPCSERLPEENTNVIACFSNGTVTELAFYNGEFHGLFSYTTKVIVAWMPLPKPYKRGSADEKRNII